MEYLCHAIRNAIINKDLKSLLMYGEILVVCFFNRIYDVILNR